MLVRGAGSRPHLREGRPCVTHLSDLPVWPGSSRRHNCAVRCPACKTVFSPATGLAPEPEPEEEEPQAEEVEDDRPRKRKPAKAEQESNNRDFEPGYFDEKPEEAAAVPRRKQRRALSRRAGLPSGRVYPRRVGLQAHLDLDPVLHGIDDNHRRILVSGRVAGCAEPTYVTVAGAIGIFTWITGAIGIGLCLSGPTSPGHWGYGIAAAVAAVLHLILLSVLIGQGKEYSIGKEVEATGSSIQWGLVPTRLDAVAFYMTLLAYKDEELLPKGDMTLSIVVGVAELLRNVLMLMLVSCLARAAGDNELSHQGTRGAGFACFGPGVLAILMLLIAMAIIETNAQTGALAKILFTTVRMGTYAILIGMMFPGLMATRETADACEEPFQGAHPEVMSCRWRRGVGVSVRSGQARHPRCRARRRFRHGCRNEGEIEIVARDVAACHRECVPRIEPEARGLKQIVRVVDCRSIRQIRAVELDVTRRPDAGNCHDIGLADMDGSRGGRLN